mgnify:CR=1 FL=1
MNQVEWKVDMYDRNTDCNICAIDLDISPSKDCDMCGGESVCIECEHNTKEKYLNKTKEK